MWKELQKERFCGDSMCEVIEESKRVFFSCSIVRKGESEVGEVAGGTHSGRPCRPCQRPWILS